MVAGSPGSDAARDRLTFRRRQRLAHARQFEAVYAAKARKVRGPLVVFALPNTVGHCRLGLSVGRPVGTAVARNRVKRMLREAFRLDQAAWAKSGAAAYDLVVTVRPHRPMPLDGYRAAMRELVADLDVEWRRRQRRAEREGQDS
jgi:ribonuclease P protein component